MTQDFVFFVRFDPAKHLLVSLLKTSTDPAGICLLKVFEHVNGLETSDKVTDARLAFGQEVIIVGKL